MNRLDRLFAILLHLQHKPRVRAQDLAAKFEVSKRTIYRDIAALNQSGVPIVSLPGEGYTLVEGFYLPPLVFTPEEASTLFLGAQMLVQQAAGNIIPDAERALDKIAVALPVATRQQVEQLTKIIQFITPEARFNLDDPSLLTLQRAIQERRAVCLRYHSYARNKTTERVVEPYQLYYARGIWYFSGYCRLRQGVRTFRLERSEQLILLRETFTGIKEGSPDVKDVAVRVRFAPETVRWVHERQHYAFQEEEPDPGGQGVVMTYRMNNLSELKPWLLGWGASAEVLAPLEFRREIGQEAKKLAEMLT